MTETKVWIEYEENTDYSDGERAGHREFRLIAAWTERPFAWTVEEFELPGVTCVSPGAPLYVVYVRYDSGGTDHSTYDNWGIVGVFVLHSQAKAVAQSIKDRTYPGMRFWEGYFEHLNDIRVHPLTLF